MRLEEMFQPGRFVMLHPHTLAAGNPHKDAGRIGKIIESADNHFMVELWDNEESGHTLYSILDINHWLPVPTFCVEEYTKNKKRGYKLNSKGIKTFEVTGWETTPATLGADNGKFE